MSTTSDVGVLVTARKLLAVRLLNEGEDPGEVRLYAGVRWGVLLDWCFDTDGRRMVADDLLEDLTRLAEQASSEAQAVEARRRAESGERSTDSDRAYRHLKEEVEAMKHEYRAAHGIPYVKGWDDELDARVTLLEHWYG